MHSCVGGHSPLVTGDRFATSTIVKTSSPTPDAILQTVFGFWNSKVLLTAVTFDLFSTLGQHRLTGAEIGKKLELHPRGIADFLDALVAMKFLEREGDGADAKYFNTPHGSVSRPQQPALHRRNPRDAQCTVVQVLE
jgi:Dimerisation domain